MKSIKPVTIIIPTYNNPEMLGQCLSSIAAHRDTYPVEILVINNGHPESVAFVEETDWLKVVQTGGKNLGWEGGLKKGLEISESEFVMFLNDDVFIPPASKAWLRDLIDSFHGHNVGAVGPSTNVVMGPQNIWRSINYSRIETSYLIGFCLLLKRSALDQVGGVDDTLPGGDDLDLSIRLIDAGYKLVARRDVFVYHHGFVTGTRVHGDASRIGGWNSVQMTEKTDNALIRKHGFKRWYLCRAGLQYPAPKVQSEKELAKTS